MRIFRTLPLGVDIGATRVRVAAAERDREGNTRVRAVVSRELPHGSATSGKVHDPEFVGLLIEEMVNEIGGRERRCVAAVGAPDAALRMLRLPKMTSAERKRAARYEAQRFAPWDLNAETSLVRIHPVDRSENLYAVGAVRREVVESRLAALRAGGLRTIAMEHDAFALHRALPSWDAILDIGNERAVLHVFGERGSSSWSIPAGGAEITRGIARDLSIDETTAERRKRILGSAGAGFSGRDGLVDQLRAGVARARNRFEISKIALTGNGARLPGLTDQIEIATAAVIEMPVADVLLTAAYPQDVIRAAAPDWLLAAGLSTWKATA